MDEIRVKRVWQGDSEEPRSSYFISGGRSCPGVTAFAHSVEGVVAREGTLKRDIFLFMTNK